MKISTHKSLSNTDTTFNGIKSKITNIHTKSRLSPYPGSTIKRFKIPDDQVMWEVDYFHVTLIGITHRRHHTLHTAPHTPYTAPHTTPYISHAHTHACTRTHACTCMHSRMHTCTHVRTSCMHMYRHTYAHMCTHTHITIKQTQPNNEHLIHF